MANGVTYRVVASSGCANFTVSAGGDPVVKICPHNLIFDTAQCACNWPKQTKCINSCSENGNTYTVVEGTECEKFTVQAGSNPPVELKCPASQVFDTSICVCNRKKDVNCPGSGDPIGF